MLGLISSSSVVLAIVGGIPVTVVLLAAIWVRPRRAKAAWALISLLLVAGLAGGVAAAFAEKGTPGVSAAEAPLPASSSSAPQTTCSPNGTALTETVHNIHFSTTCLAAPAGTAFTIAFDNQDPSTTHNIHIFASDPATHPGAASLFAGDLVTGPATKTYQVGPLSAGTYFFHCDVHPTRMFGVFIVAAG
jgi:plastocyanin